MGFCRQILASFPDVFQYSLHVLETKEAEITEGIYIRKAAKLENHVKDEKGLLLKSYLLAGLLALWWRVAGGISAHLCFPDSGIATNHVIFSFIDMSIYVNLCNMVSLLRDALITFDKEDRPVVKDMLHYSLEV
jgi:hypothetical protein